MWMSVQPSQRKHCYPLSLGQPCSCTSLKKVSCPPHHETYKMNKNEKGNITLSVDCPISLSEKGYSLSFSVGGTEWTCLACMAIPLWSVTWNFWEIQSNQIQTSPIFPQPFVTKIKCLIDWAWAVMLNVYQSNVNSCTDYFHPMMPSC